MALDTSDAVKHCVQVITRASSGLVSLVYPASLDGFFLLTVLMTTNFRGNMPPTSKSVIESLVPFFLIFYFYQMVSYWT